MVVGRALGKTEGLSVAFGFVVGSALGENVAPGGRLLGTAEGPVGSIVGLGLTLGLLVGSWFTVVGAALGTCPFKLSGIPGLA